jgi:hypothetical protein
MRWFYDSTHGTRALGDLVQDRIFGMRTVDEVDAAAFGVRLRSAVIEEHLAAVRADRAVYRAAFPRDVEEVEAAAARASGHR